MTAQKKSASNTARKKPSGAKSSSADRAPARAKSNPKSAKNAESSAENATRSSRDPSYWLVKSEPSSFSFADLLAAPKRRSGWDGVRNYQARNYLRDAMRIGDLVLFYHSSTDPSGVAGLARVASAAYPDPTQFDPRDHHFDPAARRESPTWVQVDLEALVPLARFVSLEDLKRDARFSQMLVLKRGQRLSIQPVQPGEWRAVLALGGLDPDDFCEMQDAPRGR